MSDNTKQADEFDQDIANRKLVLEEEKLKLDERQLALNESFPKKWGTSLFSAAAMISVAIISGTFAHYQFEQTDRLKNKQQIQAETERRINNAKTALELYFNNIENLKIADERAVQHLALIAEISELGAVRAIFYDMRQSVIEQGRKDNPDLEIADIANKLPIIKHERDYDPSEITAWVQYPKSDTCVEIAEKMRTEVIGIGMRVPGLEAIEIARNPNDNVIKFYSTLQKSKMADLSTELASKTGLNFKTEVLKNVKPTNFIEIWIGKNSCVTS